MNMQSAARSARLLIAVLALAACASPQGPAAQTSQAQTPAQPKRIVAAIKGEPSVLITNVGGTGVPGTDQVRDLLNAGLSAIDPQSTLHPVLAEAVPTTENGLWKLLPDGRMETTWHIRPGTAWHDGTPFTSEDLVFTTLLSRDREVTVFANIAYESVESVEAPDAQTILIRWRRPFIQADTLFTGRVSSPMPKHLLGRIYEENKGAFTEVPYWSTDFVGTGPFRLRDWVRGSHVLLTANERFVLGRPKLDDIEVRFILDSNTLAANILAGSVDMTFNRTLSLDQALEVRQQWRDGRVDITIGGWLVIFPQFINPNPAIIGDVQFRRAMLHAIDRQAMADSLLGGLSAVAHVGLGPDQPHFNDIQSSVVRYDYDPRSAAEMVQSLGYSRGPDGMFREGTGQPLAVELRTSGEFDIHVSAQIATADYWRRLGVAVDPVIIPPQRSNDREWVQTFPGFLDYNQPTDIDAMKRMVSAQTPLPLNNFVGRNHARYMNPEYDRLIDRFFVTIPREERMEILRQVVRIQTDQLTSMGLFYNTSPIMVAGRLQNLDRGSTYNAHQWDLK